MLMFRNLVQNAVECLAGRAMEIWPDIYYQTSGKHDQRWHIDGASCRGLKDWTMMATDGYLMEIGELCFYMAEKMDGPEQSEPGKLAEWVESINQYLLEHDKKKPHQGWSELAHWWSGSRGQGCTRESAPMATSVTSRAEKCEVPSMDRQAVRR